MRQENNIPTLASYNTLEEIRQQKDRLTDLLDEDTEKMATMWTSLFRTNENASKGEHIATLIANSVTAIDAFLLVRKLMKNYSGLFSFFRKGKKLIKGRS